jgi:hypothetical protein
MRTCLTAAAALDRHFLETRCKIIEIAANLDRIDRGADANVAQPPSAVSGGTDPSSADPRLTQIRMALQTLLEPGPDRAEKCQMVFSLPYEPDWKRPR